MTLIYLARHGETEWNADKRIQGHTNSSLSDLGRRQAVALAERLRHCEISSIYSSDLTRAMDTAAPIAAILDLPVTPMESLRERGYGEWEGLSLDEVAERFPEQWHRYHVLREIDSHIPGGEAWEQVYKRIVPVVEMAVKENPGDDKAVLLVGHGGSMRIAVLHALGAPLGMITRFRLDNAGLSCLEYRNFLQGRVTFLNDTGHLSNTKL